MQAKEKSNSLTILFKYVILFAEEKIMKEKFSVTGMSCAACSSGIERAVRRLDGVKSVEVSLMGESMLVEYDEKQIPRDKIIQTVVELGYGATLFKENVLKERKPQPNKLMIRFFISLALDKYTEILFLSIVSTICIISSISGCFSLYISLSFSV